MYFYQGGTNAILFLVHGQKTGTFWMDTFHRQIDTVTIFWGKFSALILDETFNRILYTNLENDVEFY